MGSGAGRKREGFSKIRSAATQFPLEVQGRPRKTSGFLTLCARSPLKRARSRVRPNLKITFPVREKSRVSIGSCSNFSTGGIQITWKQQGSGYRWKKREKELTKFVRNYCSTAARHCKVGHGRSLTPYSGETHQANASYLMKQ
jgi:hypothetical protein